MDHDMHSSIVDIDMLGTQIFYLEGFVLADL
jgi:hypothetical protein